MLSHPLPSASGRLFSVWPFPAPGGHFPARPPRLILPPPRAPCGSGHLLPTAAQGAATGTSTDVSPLGILQGQLCLKIVTRPVSS